MSEFIDRLHLAAKCVFIEVPKQVAKEISTLLKLAATEILSLESALAAETKHREEAEADNARLREALTTILSRDVLVEANEDAFSVHALRRVKEIAAAALAKPEGGAS